MGKRRESDRTNLRTFIRRGGFMLMRVPLIIAAGVAVFLAAIALLPYFAQWSA